MHFCAVLCIMGKFRLLPHCALPSAWILHQFAENNHFFHLNSLYIMYPLQSVQYKTSIQYVHKHHLSFLV